MIRSTLALLLLAALPAAAQQPTRTAACAAEVCTLHVEASGLFGIRTDLYRGDERLNNPVLLGLSNASVPIREAVAGTPDAVRHALRFERLQREEAWVGVAIVALSQIAFLSDDHIDPGLRGVARLGQASLVYVALSLRGKQRDALTEAARAYNADLLR
jgi:hypothetical protein